jgi:hypothetical protein
MWVNLIIGISEDTYDIQLGDNHAKPTKMKVGKTYANLSGLSNCLIDCSTKRRAAVDMRSTG